MECIAKTNFWTEPDSDDYQPKNSVQSYLCPDYAVQKTEQIAPMECWPEE